MSLSRRFRLYLCDLLEQQGALAPTLCGSWRAQDLAAHLWIRERRPSAMPGILVDRFAARTERLQVHALHQLGFDELVRRLRRSPFGPLDPAINTAEYVIHYLDVAKPAGVPRPSWEEEDDRVLARFALLFVRKAHFPGRVVLDTPSGERSQGQGSDIIHLVGDAAEALYFLSGRTEHADLEIIGDGRAKTRLLQAIAPM